VIIIALAALALIGLLAVAATMLSSIISREEE
jgi:hypothetical protein